jgi:predicted ribosomally synthesized peptide with SipW-like signal peptide
MKKILMSLSIIAAAGAIVATATTAYFSDTETSTGNTFTAGTIDISVDNQNPWEESNPYTLGDLKPGESDNINLTVRNVGTNPVKVSKKLTGMAGDGGTNIYDCALVNSNCIAYDASSEPECVAECGLNTATPTNNIETQVLYSLDVEVYNSQDCTGDKAWWQTIYTDEDNLASIYTDYVKLGTIPVSGCMKVNQTYKLNPLADNQFQGDRLTFNMELKGEQLAQGEEGEDTVTLENKGGAPDWAINSTDGINGVLEYKTTGDTFDFDFSANTASNQAYTLIYVGGDGNYPAGSSIKLGEATASSNHLSFTGNIDTGSIVDGKVWLIPSSDYDSGNTIMTGWHNDQNLYETSQINYTKN